jgi:hypothetical protein
MLGPSELEHASKRLDRGGDFDCPTLFRACAQRIAVHALEAADVGLDQCTPICGRPSLGRSRIALLELVHIA